MANLAREEDAQADHSEKLAPGIRALQPDFAVTPATKKAKLQAENIFQPVDVEFAP
jgi:hypothetical protein